jgi:hypothetical protein
VALLVLFLVLKEIWGTWTERAGQIDFDVLRGHECRRHRDEFGYRSQGLRSLNSPRCLAWRKDEGALETWLADNERGRRSKLRLYENELQILEN